MCIRDSCTRVYYLKLVQYKLYYYIYIPHEGQFTYPFTAFVGILQYPDSINYSTEETGHYWASPQMLGQVSFK